MGQRGVWNSTATTTTFIKCHGQRKRNKKKTLARRRRRKYATAEHEMKSTEHLLVIIFTGRFLIQIEAKTEEENKRKRPVSAALEATRPVSDGLRQRGIGRCLMLMVKINGDNSRFIISAP